MNNLVISTNNKINYPEFQTLMRNSTNHLNDLTINKPNYFLNTSAKNVEKIVYEAMKYSAEGTPFEGTIELVSGHKFPDIIAGKYYGTEVKSTQLNKWDGFGNSIFEGTRVTNIDRIYITFGKMSSPIEFKSKPYEECISGIVVDHSPRYHIDMKIQEKKVKTIFEVLGISYDDFRRLPNTKQVELIATKSRESLKDGESLWWSQNNKDKIFDQKLKLFSTLSLSEKERITAKALGLFPELLGFSNRNKYNRFLMWLVTENNIVTGNVRDSFSSGGQINFTLKSGLTIRVPAVLGRLVKYKDLIVETINSTEETELKEYWNVQYIDKDRISQWINLCIPLLAGYNNIGNKTAIQIFHTIFDI